MSALALTFQNTQFDVIDRNNQPWLRMGQIAPALGYKDQRDCNKVYARNADEFTDQMTALIELDTDGGKQQVRIFSLRGCHLLGMLARTKIAKEFRKWVLDVLEHHTQTTPTLADIERLIDQRLNAKKPAPPPMTRSRDLNQAFFLRFPTAELIDVLECNGYQVVKVNQPKP